jgi:glycosyltransferase involved in cell wall biosynthesis
MKTDSPLISIIIPVHNAGSFLEECLQSVTNQTYKNLEIITVDDDSTDTSKKTIKKHQGGDKRIKYLHVKNHNAAQTRREGVARATAEYICFVDADDILHEKYVEILYQALRESGAKISAGKIMSVPTSSDIAPVVEDTGKVSIENNPLTYFGNNYHSHKKSRHIAQSINAKLFTSDVFADIDYSVLRTSILEDNYILAQLLQKTAPQKIALVDTTIYYYRQNPNSTMGSALDHMIKYEDEELSYPQLFEKTMDYINNLYHNSADVIACTNKIKIEEYYNLAEIVVDRNIRIKDLDRLIKDMRNHIESLESQQEVLNNEIQAIVNSNSYKIGRKVTAPVRKFKKTS